MSRRDRSGVPVEPSRHPGGALEGAGVCSYAEAMARRLTVVNMVGAFVTGGAELMAKSIATNLDRDRFRSILCVTRAEPPVADDLDGAELLQLRRRSKVDLGAWRPLVRLLRRERVDVLHSHGYGANVSASILARLTSVPVFVAHEHTWSYRGNPLRVLLDGQLIGRTAAAFLTESPEDARRMAAVEHVDPARIRVVPMPPLAFAAPPSDSGCDLRARLGIASDAPLVGLVAALRPEKHVEALVEAASRLTAEFPDLCVVVAGDGPARPALDHLVERSSLGGVVRMLGEVPPGDVPSLLDAFDVAVSCSLVEGRPAAVVEYMAAARPIVATAVGGVPHLIRNGIDGLLVPPDDRAALTGAIATLLRDRPRALELGRQARERQRREFALVHLLEQLEELYSSMWLATDRGRRESSRLAGAIS